MELWQTHLVLVVVGVVVDFVDAVHAFAAFNNSVKKSSHYASKR